MFADWNLVLTVIIAVFCGQSIGFWPFDASAANVPDYVSEESNAKRIAIIGMFYLHFHY
jgi:hypothetical protein